MGTRSHFSQGKGGREAAFAGDSAETYERGAGPEVPPLLVELVGLFVTRVRAPDVIATCGVIRVRA